MRALLLFLLAACGRVAFDPIDDAGVTADADASDATMAFCAGRTLYPVPASGIVSHRVVDLTDAAEGTCGGAASNDIAYWLDVVAGGSLVVATDLPTATADSLIYVRRSCDDPTSEVACDRDGGLGERAAYRLVDPGAGRYVIFLDSEAPNGRIDGVIQSLLPAGAACTAEARDRCGPELTCTNGACEPAGCAITASFTLAPGEIVTNPYTTTGGINHHAGPPTCTQGNDSGVRGNDLVFQVDLSGTARLRVSTAGATTNFDTVAYIRASCGGPELACNDDAGGTRAIATTPSPVAAGTYFVFVDGFGGESGNVTVEISAPL